MKSSPQKWDRVKEVSKFFDQVGRTMQWDDGEHEEYLERFLDKALTNQRENIVQVLRQMETNDGPCRDTLETFKDLAIALIQSLT